MYQLQANPDKHAQLVGGGSVTPLATLKDEYGGISHIIKDDNCYVLINGSEVQPYFTMVTHWYQEAAKALAGLQGVT